MDQWLFGRLIGWPSTVECPGSGATRHKLACELLCVRSRILLTCPSGKYMASNPMSRESISLSMCKSNRSLSLVVNWAFQPPTAPVTQISIEPERRRFNSFQSHRNNFAYQNELTLFLERYTIQNAHSIIQDVRYNQGVWHESRLQ